MLNLKCALWRVTRLHLKDILGCEADSEAVVALRMICFETFKHQVDLPYAISF